jgi:hypothetical protein
MACSRVSLVGLSPYHSQLGVISATGLFHRFAQKSDPADPC